MKKGFVILSLLIIMFIGTSSSVSAHAYSFAFTQVDFAHNQTTLQFAIDDLSIIESVEGTDLNDDYFLDQEEVIANKENILEWMGQHFTFEVNGERINMKDAQLSLHQELPFKEQFQYEHDLNYEEIMMPDSKIVVASLVFQALSDGDTVHINDSFYINSILTENYGNFLNFSYQGEIQTTTVMFGYQRTYTFQVDGINQVSNDSPRIVNSIVDWKRFFWLGSEHILFGFDHLLFLFTLILLKMRIQEYIKIITSFTIAHSISLALAVTGVISIPSKFVESLIIISIIYVALENIFFPNNAKNRWWITFLLGLLHGLAFAELLTQMKLPKDQLIQSLLSFNIGIEITQLLLVFLLFPFLWVWHRSRWYPKTFILLNILAIGIGAIWLYNG